MNEDQYNALIARLDALIGRVERAERALAELPPTKTVNITIAPPAFTDVFAIGAWGRELRETLERTYRC